MDLRAPCIYKAWMVSLRRSVLIMVSIKGLRNVLSRATATSGLRWISMGQSELTSLARNDVTSLVCGMSRWTCECIGRWGCRDY